MGHDVAAVVGAGAGTGTGAGGRSVPLAVHEWNPACVRAPRVHAGSMMMHLGSGTAQLGPGQLMQINFAHNIISERAPRVRPRRVSERACVSRRIFDNVCAAAACTTATGASAMAACLAAARAHASPRTHANKLVALAVAVFVFCLAAAFFFVCGWYRSAAMPFGHMLDARRDVLVAATIDGSRIGRAGLPSQSSQSPGDRLASN